MRVTNRILLMLAIVGMWAISAFGQGNITQPPLRPYSSFSASRPMQQWNCAQTMQTLGTPEVAFLSLTSAYNGFADCGGSVSNGGDHLTLSSAMLLEFNNANTLTHAAAAVNGFTTYTGTITNCAVANALKGGWYAVASFTSSGNNGTFGPVSACTSTTITLPNSGGVLETHAGTATNKGYQVAAPLTGTYFAIVKPSDLMASYHPGSTGYTLGNADNVFKLTIPTNLPGPTWVSGSGLALNSFITTTGTILFSNLTPFTGTAAALTGQPVILELTGTSPALTLGNGTVLISLQYNSF